MDRSRVDPERPAWLFVDLWAAARRSVRLVAQLLDAEGVGDNELAALLHLSARAAGLTVTELAAEMGAAFMSASDAVARLEQGGDVERAPHPTDGRATVVKLTPAGARRARAALKLLDPLAEEIARRGGASMAELVGLVERLHEVVSAPDSDQT